MKEIIINISKILQKIKSKKYLDEYLSDEILRRLGRKHIKRIDRINKRK